MRPRVNDPIAPVARLAVAIRADASGSIGAGHVIRCLALATVLREKGHEAEFVMGEADGDLRDLVAERHGFRVTTLTPASPGAHAPADELDDARKTLGALAGRHVDWVIVDHYGLGARWETTIQSSGRHVLAIDDHASRDHACDIVVDHNLTPANVYATRVAPNTELLLGPRYALLRPEFARFKSPRPTAEHPEIILVSFGGVDPSGQTSRALRALQEAQRAPRRLIALAGRDNPDLERLRAMAADWPALEIHEFVDDAAALMQEADLAIGAGGVSALERLAAGVPSIVQATADNQEHPAEALANEGALLYLGPAAKTDDATLARAIATMANRHLREAMRRRGLALVDGHGPQRILRAIRRRTPVTVRPAADHDRLRIHAWRNHRVIRATAFDASEIPRTAHERWFEGVLADPDRHLLVAEHRGTPIGVIRYDLNRKHGTAELSIFLAPEVLGLGLGKPALVAANAWLAEHETDITRIDAQVLGNNQRSHQLFESVGFGVRRTVLGLERTTTPSKPSDNPPHGGT